VDHVGKAGLGGNPTTFAPPVIDLKPAATPTATPKP